MFLLTYRNLLLDPYQEKHHYSHFSSAYKRHRDSREPLNNNCELDYYTNINKTNNQQNNFILKPKISYEFNTIQSQLQSIVDAQRKFREKIETQKERQMVSLIIWITILVLFKLQKLSVF